METFIANLRSGKTRKAELHGREHIVAPLTLIVPGVLNGSKGPLYYPPEEITKDYSAWNGMPMVVNHPTRDGLNISARDPDVLNSSQIGIVLKSHINNSGKLQAEGWFDVAKTKQVNPGILASLEAGNAIELSTGLFTDNEPATNGANYNGKPYSFIARNYKPDHLAILPNQVGACSVRDGCGVLVNRSGKGAQVKVNKPKSRKSRIRVLTNRLQKLVGNGGPGSGRYPAGSGGQKEGESEGNQQPLVKHGDQVRSSNSKVGDTVRATAGKQAGKIGTIIRKGFDMMDVAFDKGDKLGTPYDVGRLVHHKVETNNAYNNTPKQGDSAMTEQEKKAIVDNLIANVCCWKETDRATLNTLSEATLNNLQEAGRKATEAEAVVNAVKEGFNTLYGPEKAKAITVNAMPAALQAAMEAKKAKEGEDTEEEVEGEGKPVKNKKPCANQTAAEWLEAAPAEVQVVVRNAMRLDSEEKAQLIQQITANKNNPFTSEQLGGMSTEQLRPIAKLATPIEQSKETRVSFMGANAPFTTNAEQKVDRADYLPLPTMDFSKK